MTAQALRQIVSYDPATGLLVRIKACGRRFPAGSAVGSVDPRGYVDAQIQGCRDYAHRFIWLYVTGAWPEDEIDHRNGVKSDNRWANLREATGVLNQQNKRHAQSNSSTGLRGVLVSSPGRYCARIRVNGVNKHLGSYPTPEAAHAAYIKAKAELHPFWAEA